MHPHRHPHPRPRPLGTQLLTRPRSAVPNLSGHPTPQKKISFDLRNKRNLLNLSTVEPGGLGDLSPVGFPKINKHQHTMIKTISISALAMFAATGLTFAHCGKCEHKDGEKKEGEGDKKEEAKEEAKFFAFAAEAKDEEKKDDEKKEDAKEEAKALADGKCKDGKCKEKDGEEADEPAVA